jgi:hypothetical protein
VAKKVGGKILPTSHNSTTILGFVAILKKGAVTQLGKLWQIASTRIRAGVQVESDLSSRPDTGWDSDAPLKCQFFVWLGAPP